MVGGSDHDDVVLGREPIEFLKELVESVPGEGWAVG